MAKVDVYVGIIPKKLQITPLFPPERELELDGACDKVKKEKVFSWQLLDHALNKSFSYSLKDLALKRSANGKWECDKCYFSITHSKGVVAVAVADEPIGIDLEMLNRDTWPIEKTLTESEKKGLSKINGDKDRFLIKKWTEKESLYKKRGEGAFNPFKIETTGEFFVTKWLEFGGEVFALTVACNENSIVNL